MAYEKEEKSGTDSDTKILEDCQKNLKLCVEEEASERMKMEDDLRFRTLDQWPREIRTEREGDVENGPRPCLTIDKINQYRTQIVNDMRQGKPGILVRPQDDQADPETAKILKGLIRNIEDQSSADIAYMVAGGNAVDIGLGYFRITSEYIPDDSGDQELFIRPIPNTFSVYLSKHLMPDGSDAKRGYIAEAMPIPQFKKAYPKAKYAATYFADMDQTIASYWHTTETITVVEEYVLERVEEQVFDLVDGTSMLESEYKKWPSWIPKIEVKEKRRSFREQLRWRKMTGCEVLDKRDLPGKYIPIVECIGSEAWVDGKRILWGIVRPAKDSLRMYNYWASLITEKMALAPKTPYIGAKGQFEGVEAKWKQANKKNYPYLEYNDVSMASGNSLPPPQRQPATPMEAALLQQMQVIEHDVQTSLGMFKAAVGETESQQSGRAILALQKESDTGTYHFGANLGVSIRHAGRILVDLIPHYYDTKRVVRILGEDGEVQTVTLDPDQPKAMNKVQGDKGIETIYNPGVGKYDISITVGPSYNTKRMEAAATFVELARSSQDPATAAVMNYLTVRNSDFTGADEAAKMLKSLLPPPALQALSQGQPIPPEAQAKMAQMQQMLQLAQQKMQEMQEENVKLQTGAQSKMAAVQVQAQESQQKAQLAQQEAQAELNLQKQKQDGELQLAREKAEAEIAIKRAVAEAEHNIKIAEMKLEAENTERQMAMENEQKKKQADFDMSMKAREGMPPEMAAQAYKQDLMKNDVMPQMMEALQSAFTQMGESLQQMVALQEQTLAVIQAPKKVSIGGVQRDSAGNITGANVATATNAMH